MKKIFLFIFIVFTLFNLIYAKEKKIMFSHSFGKRKVELKSDSISNNDQKILFLKDINENILDSVEIFYPDTSYTGSVLKSDSAFAIRVTAKNPYRNCFIYASSSSNSFSYYDCDKWVASGIITDDFIIYSTEFDSNTIKRISLDTGEIFAYDGWFPNVSIYADANSDILGFFEYDGYWYEIMNNIIVKSEKKYNRY